MRWRLAGHAVASLLLTACHDRSSAPPLASATPTSSPDAGLAPPARRPTRRYYLGRLASGCEIFSLDADQVSHGTPTPCPLDLQPGERIRLTGKSCIREGSARERHEPVVCPAPLLTEEELDRFVGPRLP